jgi:hypothetical protein
MFTHIDQLNGQEVIKSHCCLCFNPIGRINKKTKGNCCIHCNWRANQVARNLMTEHESDLILAMRKVDKSVEKWIIDGVPYTKYPSGELKSGELKYE